MRLRPSVRIYCEFVFLVACAAILVVHGQFGLNEFGRHPLVTWTLAIGVVVSELLPVTIPRREDEVITLSACFVMALLLASGLGPALVAQAGASVVQDIVSGKPIWRVRFNLGQYALSLICALLVLHVFSGTLHTGSAHPYDSQQLPGVLLSCMAFLLVNTTLVGCAVALHTVTPIGRYFRQEFAAVLVTAGVLLLLAPVVIATAAFSPLLVPLLAAPILAMHKVFWQGARSDHAARHDPLTGLPNRAAFHEAVDGAVASPERESAVMLMDLDRFKEVNDTLGHHIGDLLLKEVASRLRAQLRGDDLIARLGGDEFAVLCFACGANSAGTVAHRLIDALRPPFRLEDTVVDVQASIGIAVFPSDGVEQQTLLQRADVAMYQAKARRAGVVLYQESEDHHSPSKLKRAADLRVALEGEEVVAFFQPVLDLRTKRVAWAEALVRWQHPELGLLGPFHFLDVAEQAGLIRQLTYRVLDLSLRQICEWERLGYRIGVAVNISASVLREGDFAERVREALAQHGLEPARLKLEITESVLMTDPAATREVLQELHEFGIEISIDDFGTGYSSLAYLADLPVSEVKIDRSFVMKMQQGRKEAIIVHSTIELAHALGMRAVAEGVEDLEMIPQLTALGCDAAQGYGLREPADGADITVYLKEMEATVALEARAS